MRPRAAFLLALLAATAGAAWAAPPAVEVVQDRSRGLIGLRLIDGD